MTALQYDIWNSYRIERRYESSTNVITGLRTGNTIIIKYEKMTHRIINRERWTFWCPAFANSIGKRAYAILDRNEGWVQSMHSFIPRARRLFPARRNKRATAPFPPEKPSRTERNGCGRCPSFFQAVRERGFYGTSAPNPSDNVAITIRVPSSII